MCENPAHFTERFDIDFSSKISSTYRIMAEEKRVWYFFFFKEVSLILGQKSKKLNFFFTN